MSLPQVTFDVVALSGPVDSHPVKFQYALHCMILELAFFFELLLSNPGSSHLL